MDKLRRRASGILLHVTSLPGGHGAGDLGPEARRFVDFLAESRQAWWQTLPVGPIGAANSPYSSPSTFAGSPWMISLDDLVADGLLEVPDLSGSDQPPEGRVDYDRMVVFKEKRLRKAYSAFMRDGSAEQWAGFREFVKTHQHWVEDYALYNAFARRYEGRPWTLWDPIVRSRQFRLWPREIMQGLGEESAFHQFAQYLFAKQWSALKRYAAERGVGLIGDVPIFAAHESADVWARPELFQLDADGNPAVVAGVPPDYFSKTGQLWGNPHYQWDRLRESGYDWWLERLGAAAERFDAVRLDHFIGFQRYWEIPAGVETAAQGRWMPGPGADFFAAVRAKLPELELIAEDLGPITSEVAALRDQFDFPGMRVLQFAFGGDPQAESFLPHRYPRRTVAYTGTHDNDTVQGWYRESSTEDERHNARVYLHCDGHAMHRDMLACVFRSPADTAMFPIQDLLGLGSEARMNTPGTVEGNWQWRLRPGQLDDHAARLLARLTEDAGRAGRTT